MSKKANRFFQIQNATSFNIPVDINHEFYTDFSEYRSTSIEKKLFRLLGIEHSSKECNDTDHQKIFLSGYRGTGKTSELLTIKQKIDDTQCYLPVFVDIANEELDVNNIETVDILILMVEKLLAELESRGADISNLESIKEFFDWYSSKIVKELNNKLEGSAQVETGFNTDTTILGKLLGIFANTKLKLAGSQESKTIIRREITNNFTIFSDRVNEFIRSIVKELKRKEKYQDILFIVDGFEKIGSLDDREKILIRDSNKLTKISTHMIITLPIELFEQRTKIIHIGEILNFPLVNLAKDGAKEKFREFILKRVDETLFDSSETIDLIVKYGAGHPRQTLQIIKRAYIVAEKDIIDKKSVEDAIEILGNELSKVNEDEIKILKQIKDGKPIPFSKVFAKLKSENVIFEYDNNLDSHIINPVVLQNSDFNKLLEQI